MSQRIIPITKPIRRRIGDITIIVNADEVWVRGKGKRTWHRIAWSRILSLIESDNEPVIVAAEVAAGERVSERLTKRRKRRVGCNPPKQSRPAKESRKDAEAQRET